VRTVHDHIRPNTRAYHNRRTEATTIKRIRKRQPTVKNSKNLVHQRYSGKHLMCDLRHQYSIHTLVSENSPPTPMWSQNHQEVKSMCIQ
ncbi:hypothetical protein GCK32_020828, partial [Trichostrongylus colubriformis]